MDFNDGEKMAAMEYQLKLAKLALDAQDFDRSYKCIERAKAIRATITVQHCDF